MQKGIDRCKPATVTHISEIIKTAVSSVARPRRRTRAPGRSETEDSLRAAFSDGLDKPGTPSFAARRHVGPEASDCHGKDVAVSGQCLERSTRREMGKCHI